MYFLCVVWWNQGERVCCCTYRVFYFKFCISVNQRKRKYAIFQPSSVLSCSDSSPLIPQLKRSRKLSSSDESCDMQTNSGASAVAAGVTGDGKPVPPMNGSNAIVNAENERPDACVIYERIKFLQEAFPNLSRQVIIVWFSTIHFMKLNNFSVEIAPLFLVFWTICVILFSRFYSDTIKP